MGFQPMSHRQDADATFIHGAVRNFWRVRRSGYFGKKTSAIKTLSGVNSRVEIVSLYSICSPGLIKTMPGLALIAWLSDHLVSTIPAEFIK